ncbi:MAG: beta-galactosidase trimerization domain-containing protein, partial [Agathobacter sp.]|nr:beta-galactosidase trimerization domain-containing protein [Agathobacter sp.]
DSATALASYEHKVWNEYAAVTENSYGNGNSLYLGTLFGEDTLIEILEY